MKILVNLACMQPPLTGIGHYTRQLTTSLAVQPEVTAFRGLYRSRWLDAAQLHAGHGMDLPARASTKRGGMKQLLRQLPGSYALRHRLRQRHFVRQTRSYQDHLYWEPGIELMPFAGRRIATLYDLSHIVMPDSHPARRTGYLTRQVDHTLRYADAIVTISHTMQRDIAAYSGIAENAITVVPPAAGDAFYPRSPEQTADVRRRYGLPAQFILSLGTLEPRKNISRLLQAYERLPRALRSEWPLVCVGAKGWQDTALTADVSRLEARRDLIRPGYVAQQDLPALTAAAGLLAYPSLYEGFGMPVVEAMACGVAVLTSQNSAMAEIAGKNAFYVDPHSVASIAAELEQALVNRARRESLAGHGPIVSRRYDWGRSAQTLLEVFNEVS